MTPADLSGYSTVLVGNGIHCALCGRLQGVATVDHGPHPQNDAPIVLHVLALKEEPAWEYQESDCPQCHPKINPNSLNPNRLP